MRYCGKCGAVVKESTVLCTECGTHLWSRNRLKRVKRIKNLLIRSRSETWRFDEKDAAASRAAALLAYVPFGAAVSRLMAKDSPFAAFHRAQGWRLMIPEAVLLVIGLLLQLVSDRLYPTLGRVCVVLFILSAAVVLALMTVGCVTAGRGKAIRLPFIGRES